MKKSILILFLTLVFSSISYGNVEARKYILIHAPKHVSKYLNHVWDDAEWCSKEYGIPLALILAQMCLESGYGSSYYAKTRNNHLGIKFGHNYAKFCSLRNCLDAYGSSLTQNKYLDHDCESISCWLFALDSNCYHFGGNLYSNKILSIISKYKLDLLV